MKHLGGPAAHVAGGLQGVGCLCGATALRPPLVLRRMGTRRQVGGRAWSHWGMARRVMAATHFCNQLFIPFLSLLCSLPTLQRTAMAVVPPRSKESKAE